MGEAFRVFRDGALRAFGCGPEASFGEAQRATALLREAFAPDALVDRHLLTAGAYGRGIVFARDARTPGLLTFSAVLGESVEGGKWTVGRLNGQVDLREGVPDAARVASQLYQPIATGYGQAPWLPQARGAMPGDQLILTGPRD